MSETTNHPKADTSLRIDPSDLLVDQLVPMFLACSANNVTLARRVATNAVNSYRFSNQGELISVVQVVALGMATIGALSLSMANEIPLQTIVRLQSNAVAMNKSEQGMRRILRQTPPEQRRTEPPQPIPESKPLPESQPHPEPAAVAEPANPPRAEPEPQEQRRPMPRTTVPQPIPSEPPIVMTKAAAESFAAMNGFIQGSTEQLPALLFKEPQRTGFRAAALSSCVTDLLTRPASPPPGVAISRGGG